MAGFPKILVVLGPTACGKSELALAIARQHRAQILSVDSMQVYREMTIGTAKPTPQERAEIPHHLIDVVNPDEIFTVARFVELADHVIAQSANTPLIATGGTPLYYQSLFLGLFNGPSADPDLRKEFLSVGGKELHRRLSAVDPAAAARIHPNDTKRLVRALEVYQLTGQPISAHQQQWSSGTTRHPATWIGLLWDRDALNRRINARVKAMLAAGWLDETRHLLATYGSLSKTASEATGYRELIDHLHGRLSLDDAIERIKISTRQLARKQMKWFKRFPNVTWLPGDLAIDQKLARIAEFLRP